MKNSLIPAFILLPLLARALPAAIPDEFGGVEQLVDERIPNSWIVQLKDDAGVQGLDAHLSWLSMETKEVVGFRGQKDRYDIGTFKGYAGEFDEATVGKIRARPEVLVVDQDAVVRPLACKTQIFRNQGIWGLGRISHRKVGPWTEYLSNTSLPYCESTGSGVYVYIIDSGVYVEHNEFGGRATHLYTANPNWNNLDNCGHGTHVAGTAAGATYGVAKNAKIFALKALEGSANSSCGGTWNGVINSIQFAYSHARPRNRSRSVINMSLGGGLNVAVNNAVSSCVKGGLTVVVSAGNAGGDACRFSPAGAQGAIAVGASSIRDAVASFSNVGLCVDIFAPGVDVLSSFIGSPGATRIYSGTSMAAPHVAGLTLYYKCRYGFKTPKQDRLQLVRSSTKNVLVGNLCAGGYCADNNLAYNQGCS